MKKLLFQTDSSLAKTGFGRNAKALLSYLYKTKKYEKALGYKIVKKDGKLYSIKKKK